MIIPSSVIMPPCYGINQPCWIKLSNAVRDMKLWIAIRNLAPAFVVDDPGDNAWVISVFLDHDFELTFKLGLFGISWSSIGVDPHGRHILHDQQTEPITCLVKEVRLNFDLAMSVMPEKLPRTGSSHSYLHVCEPSSCQDF